MLNFQDIRVSAQLVGESYSDAMFLREVREVLSMCLSVRAALPLFADVLTQRNAVTETQP